MINTLSPGDTVILNGRFNEAVDIYVSGAENDPVTIVGDGAIIDGSGVSRDGFVLRPNASFIEIRGIRITNFTNNWGMALYGNNSHIKIEDVEIDNCDTGIHLTTGFSGQPPMFGPVDSVTLRNVSAHNNLEGGLDCTPGPCFNLTIENSRFYDNGVQAGFGADGIAVEVGDNILIRNTISASNGGDGIDLCSRNPLFLSRSANVTVRESIISDNGLQGLKLWSGGRAVNCLIHSNGLEGLVIVYNGDYLIQNCDVVRNAVLGGYAATIGYPEPQPLGNNDNITILLQNTIFAFNGLGNPTGVWVGAGVNFTSQNCIYFSRDFEEVYLEATQYPVTRDDINNGFLGTNFGVDPEFVSNTDYHLNATSPAIDAGVETVNIDLDGNPRPIGGGYDIGCYEYSSAIPPVSSFQFSPLNPLIDQQITFNASTSYDPDGSIISYQWDFGDGNTASGITVQHTYSQPGTYTVTLTVTNNDGLTASTSQQIVVTTQSGPPTGSTDTDGDGLFEDTNGDGQFNFGDVVYLFQNFFDWSQQGYDSFFDFNNDGQLNFGDVVALFQMMAR